MGKPDPPQPPDPAAIASAQTSSNLNSAIGSQVLNQTGQNTPYGSVSYAQTGSYTTPDGTVVPSFTQNTTLSPAQQTILNKSQGLQTSALDTGSKAIGNVQNTISQPFSLSGLPNAPTSVSAADSVKTFKNPNQQMNLDLSKLPAIPGINDFGAQRDQVEQALMSRFNTDWGNQQENTIARLNAQGIQSGSEGYGTEMDLLNRARNDAMMQAILGSGAEQQRMFDMASQARGQLFGETMGAGQFANDAAAQQFAQNQGAAAFQNAAQNQDFTSDLAAGQYAQGARQNALSEYALQRSQPINEFAALFGLGSGVQVPQGAAQTGVGMNPADILGANALQYQVLMNNYNTQLANKNAGLGALGNIAGALGSAGIMASDARVKTIHRRVGTTDTGFPLYLFNYVGDDRTHIGVIAQEVEPIMPEAVLEIGGVKHVDYGRL